MQLNSDILKKGSYVIGNENTVIEMHTVKPLQPFSEVVLEFFDDLSKRLLRKRYGFSDVATFAFWCRKAHLLAEKRKYEECKWRLGKGVVFHSTPSNVAVNFAFSFASGLLAGNANIVRLPAKDFPQIDIICKTILELLEEKYQELCSYVCMLKFAFDPKLLNELSNLCDCRVIWGGDETIAQIRKTATLPPRANEITFADRFSVLIIQSEGYLKLEDKKRVAEDFYNDTYLTDQNACTSPRIIIWSGDEIVQAKSMFWRMLKPVVERYDLKSVQVVGKLHAFYKAAVHEKIRLQGLQDNRLMRIQVKELTKTLMNFKYNSGFFYEYDMKYFEELENFIGDKCQTISYLGFNESELRKRLLEIRPRGGDRVVPVGKTMDFSLIWDGIDLIRSMSRVVNGV